MEAHVYRFLNVLRVQHKYDRILASFFHEIPGKFYDNEKKEWCFPIEQEATIMEILKDNKYVVNIHDRRQQALLFALHDSLFLKYDFEEAVKKEFLESFDNAEYNEEDKDFKLPIANYTGVRDFLAKYDIKYTYISQQFQSLLTYIKSKFEKREQEIVENPAKKFKNGTFNRPLSIGKSPSANGKGAGKYIKPK